MKSNKILGIVLWLIGLIAAHLILFLIPSTYTAAIWICYGFTWFAFVSQVFLWLWIWRKGLTPPEQFLYTPVLTISVIYLLSQLLVDLIFGLIPTPEKLCVLVNVLLFVIMALLLTMTLIARNSIHRLDDRQKNHHIEL